MGGHVLWLDCFDFDILDKMHTNYTGKMTSDELRTALKPLKLQAALHEQVKIMRKMEEAGLNSKEIARIIGYGNALVNELLELDWTQEYDYSQFRELKSFSIME